jgi:restriction endonuclease Mrr
MVYQPEEMVSVSGVVEEFRFHNPHCVILMTHTNPEDVKERWTIEWAGSSALRRQGVTPETLRPGDEITATGFPARDGSTAMALQVVDFADGRPSINPPDRSGANE